MADSTLNVTAFVDICAFLGYPSDDVVRGVVEDYGYAYALALELVSNAYREQDELDIANAHDELTMCTCRDNPGRACAWHGSA